MNQPVLSPFVTGALAFHTTVGGPVPIASVTHAAPAIKASVVSVDTRKSDVLKTVPACAAKSKPTEKKGIDVGAPAQLSRP